MDEASVSELSMCIYNETIKSTVIKNSEDTPYHVMKITIPWRVAVKESQREKAFYFNSSATLNHADSMLYNAHEYSTTVQYSLSLPYAAVNALLAGYDSISFSRDSTRQSLYIYP